MTGWDGHLGGVVEVLVTQEDHLVVEQCLADLGDGVIAQRAARVDAGEFGSDRARKLRNADAGSSADGVGHSESSRFGMTAARGPVSGRRPGFRQAGSKEPDMADRDRAASEVAVPVMEHVGR
jgi:hypothetical protein